LNLPINLKEFSAIINAIVKKIDMKNKKSKSHNTALGSNGLGIAGHL